MKILMALTYYYPHWTGLTAFAVRLAEGLAARGHQVTVVTSRYQRALAREEVHNGVRIVRVQPVLRLSRGQVMPATQSWVAGELGRSLAPGDAFLPEDNVEMAAWLLRFLLDYYDDDLELALAAYNGGAGSVDAWLADPIVSDRDDLLRWIGYGETREYLAKVMLNYEVYRRLYAHDG